MMVTIARPAQAPVVFDDLEDDLDAAVGAAEQAEAEPQIYIDNCPNCKGSGYYRGPSRYGSRCFKCDGRGTLAFKTSPEQRAKAKASAAKRKAKAKVDNLAAFEAEHPEIKAWWTDSTFELAVSFREAVIKYGHLTERQLAAAHKCIESLARRQQERAEAAAKAEQNAQAVNIGEIEKAFATAKARGIKRPAMRLAEFKFKLAPDTGRNAGALYVMHLESDVYLGKIVDGKFYKSRDCSAEQEAKVVEVASAPLEAAVAYGKMYGQCSICGRELTDKVSIERGIGPICESKYF